MRKNIEKNNLKKMPIDIDKIISQVYDEISSLGIDVTDVYVKFKQDITTGYTDVHCDVFFKDAEEENVKFVIIYEKYNEYTVEELIRKLKKEFERDN